MKGVEKMEFKVVSVKVPKDMVIPDDFELMFLESDDDKLDGDIELGVIRHPWSTASDRIVCWLVQRPKPIKPDWNPPKLKKGFLTWDESCAWYWWEKRPQYHAVDSWTYPEGRCVFESEEIGSMMAKILGCPDCTGFDERHCIWEVGG